MKFLGYDSPIMSFLSKMADLLFLNVLTLIFSIPIITIGAATTAAHYTALKIHREEGHVWSCFWKSFKMNLKQSTGIWLIFVVYSVVSVVAYLVYGNMGSKVASAGQGFLMATLIFAAFVYAWVMPLQSRFVNTIRTTFKNAFYMAFRYFFRTLLMTILNALPVGLFLFIFLVLGLRGFPVWMLYGISVPIYWCALLYDKIFEQLEEIILENEQEEQIEAE